MIEAPAVVTTAPSRPAAPVNPTAQPRPAAPANVKAPTTRRPTAADAPDISKAPKPPGTIPSALKEGLKKIYDQGQTPPESLGQQPNPPPAKPDAAAEAGKAQQVADAEKTKADAKAAEAPKAEALKEPASDEGLYSEAEAPKDMSPAAKDNWEKAKQKARKSLQEKEQELADARSQLDTLKKATPVELAEVEKLKSESKALRDRMAILDLPSTPEYREQFTKPKEAALAEAKEVLDYNGKEQTDLKAILGLPQKEFAAKVAELTKEMNIVDANSVVSGLRAAYKIGAEEKAALATAGELKAGIEAKYAAQNKASFEEEYRALNVDSMVKPFEIPAGTSAEDRAVIEKANHELSKVRANAESNAFGRLTPKSAATMALKAALFDQHMVVRAPIIQKGISALQAQLAKAEGELQAIKAAKGTGSFVAPAGQAPKSDAPWEDKKASLLDAAFPGRARLAGR